MTADPHTPNSAPRNALSGPESDATPPVGASRRPSRPEEPQAGAHGFRGEREAPDAAKPYRVLVTGSRSWDDRRTVWQAIASAVIADAPRTATVVLVHGACPEGADAHAAAWADAAKGHNRRPVIEEKHRANWRPGGVLDRSAGFRRNAEMVEAGADICLAFLAACTKPGCTEPKPHPSHGTSHCVDLAEQAGIPTRRFTA